MRESMDGNEGTGGESEGVEESRCSSATPVPCESERPTAYADRIGQWYSARKPDRHRKAYGLFLTPVPVADYMAGRVRAIGRRLRILDPAAGAGVLCCAAVEALVSRSPKPDAVELVAYEVDEGLIAPLRAVLGRLAGWCRARGVELAVRLEARDFIMAHAGVLHACGETLPFGSKAADFDVVIANPPYFKIARSDPRAIAASAVVHGQPNIYALFMGVAAALLRTGGDFIFITPRSFASGPYFRRFRAVFFDMIQPEEVHVFGSRRDAFSRDEVLQENVVLSGIRRRRGCRFKDGASLAISSSQGIGDIGRSTRRRISTRMALDPASPDKVLRLPVSDEEDEALTLMASWPCSLRDLGMNISTGPVVPFRAASSIGSEGKVPAKHVPLLWMNHVGAMRVSWPLARHKPEYIERLGAERLLLPNRNYVLLRRFSAKEESRRLTAAPYLASLFTIPEVGIENHLNYVHRPGGTLSEDETWGLAALYSSRLLDTWFRAVNGNTQVNAAELRTMPLPAHGTIVALGRHVKRLTNPVEGLDRLVVSLVASPRSMEAAVGED